MSEPASLDEISAFVRARDRDRYLTALFAPREVRPALMAVYAFNAELSRIPDLVSEPALGEIRLQWWRDALDRASGKAASGAPVADALMAAKSKYNLPRPLLTGMIDARSSDLDGGGFEDMQALKAYLYKTHGALFALSARICGSKRTGAAKAANAAGAAYGIVRLLLALPMDATSGRVMLPLSVLKTHGLTPEEILSGTESDKLRAVLADLADESRRALKDARGLVVGLEQGVRAVFAPLRLVEPYLRALERPNVELLHDVTEINPLGRFALLWRAARTGRF